MLHIGYKEYYTEETVNTKFLGLQILTLQKKIVEIMAAAQPRTYCRSLFKQLRDPYLFQDSIFFH